ncbi:hypothetical protein OSB04_013337 [Centaurea solstitialis]|uniref:Uncharacterized protein n=1 Tax=Centaurea solstitialis TaxID=347529 RepID=A0AA38TKM0_9ASTR|nr:hypothetical protein OSB04_013337 [Centaurea solstitialis]
MDNPKDQLTSKTTSKSSSKCRFSFPLTQNIRSLFKWDKRSSSKDSMTSQAPRVLEEHKYLRSIRDLRMDSTIPMPTTRYPRPHWAQTNPRQFWAEARLLKHAAWGRSTRTSRMRPPGLELGFTAM